MKTENYRCVEEHPNQVLNCFNCRETKCRRKRQPPLGWSVDGDSQEFRHWWCMSSFCVAFPVWVDPQQCLAWWFAKAAMPCDVAKLYHHLMFNSGEETFLSAHENVDPAPYVAIVIVLPVGYTDEFFTHLFSNAWIHFPGSTRNVQVTDLNFGTWISPVTFWVWTWSRTWCCSSITFPVWPSLLWLVDQSTDFCVASFDRLVPKYLKTDSHFSGSLPCLHFKFTSHNVSTFFRKHLL